MYQLSSFPFFLWKTNSSYTLKELQDHISPAEGFLFVEKRIMRVNKYVVPAASISVSIIIPPSWYRAFSPPSSNPSVNEKAYNIKKLYSV